MQEVTAFFWSVANYITRELIHFTGMEPISISMRDLCFFSVSPAAVQCGMLEWKLRSSLLLEGQLHSW